MTRRYEPELLRRRLHEVQVERAFRVIHRGYRPTPLGTRVTPSRFSDPLQRYSVLYASDTVRCAFWETLCRNRFVRSRRRELPRAEVESRLLVSLCSIGPLELIDLRDDGPIRIGAPTAVAHDGNHAAGRALSGAVHHALPEADGLLFVSRFTADICMAVFDRAIGKLKPLDVVDLGRHVELMNALDDYGIVLTEAPGDWMSD